MKYHIYHKEREQIDLSPELYETMAKYNSPNWMLADTASIGTDDTFIGYCRYNLYDNIISEIYLHHNDSIAYKELLKYVITKFSIDFIGIKNDDGLRQNYKELLLDIFFTPIGINKATYNIKRDIQINESNLVLNDIYNKLYEIQSKDIFNIRYNYLNDKSDQYEFPIYDNLASDLKEIIIGVCDKYPDEYIPYIYYKTDVIATMLESNTECGNNIMRNILMNFITKYYKIVRHEYPSSVSL